MNWHVEQEACNAVIALTLHVTRMDDSLLALSVRNMAGVEVLLKVGVDGDATTITSLRNLLSRKLEFEERRLAPDGRFYTAAEFDEWYASRVFVRASEMWEGAARLPQHTLELLLPNGARIMRCMDNLSINAALDSAVRARGVEDGVAKEGDKAEDGLMDGRNKPDAQKSHPLSQ